MQSQEYSVKNREKKYHREMREEQISWTEIRINTGIVKIKTNRKERKREKKGIYYFRTWDLSL